MKVEAHWGARAPRRRREGPSPTANAHGTAVAQACPRGHGWSAAAALNFSREPLARTHLQGGNPRNAAGRARRTHTRAHSHVQHAHTWLEAARRGGGCRSPPPRGSPPTPPLSQRPSSWGTPPDPTSAAHSRLPLPGTGAPSHAWGAELGLCRAGAGEGAVQAAGRGRLACARRTHHHCIAVGHRPRHLLVQHGGGRGTRRAG